MDHTTEYDIVELPSKGLYYENNKKKLKIAYLNASDENILMSPNIFKTGDIINELLKRKIVDDDILVEDLVDEDKEAVLIFLRNTSFGTEYKVTLEDPKTKQMFETIIDLSEIDFKEFTLNPNEDNEFVYELPIKKNVLTFKFLTKKRKVEYEKFISEWNGNGEVPIITKYMEMLIQSVDGDKDRLKIHNFVKNMHVKDSQTFRKYVTDNTPQLNLERTVKTPSNEEIPFTIGFGDDFFRPFYGL